MKTTKILSFVAGISMLAATLVPVKVSAASVSLSLSGASNANGTFSAVVYENSGSARVTTAKIDLGFSGAVSSISYDYSVGPFSTPTPSGAGVTQGYVTGSQAVARVSFKMDNTGSVTTSAGGSYLKGTSDDGTQIVNHSVSGGAATFTFSAPAPSNPTTGGGSSNSSSNTSQSSSSTTNKTAPNSKTSTANGTSTTATSDDKTVATTDNGSVKAASDSKSDAKTTSEDQKVAGYNPTLAIVLAVLAVLAGAGAIYARRHPKQIASAVSAALLALGLAKKKEASKPAAKKTPAKKANATSKTTKAVKSKKTSAKKTTKKA